MAKPVIGPPPGGAGDVSLGSPALDQNIDES